MLGAQDAAHAVRLEDELYKCCDGVRCDGFRC